MIYKIRELIYSTLNRIVGLLLKRGEGFVISKSAKVNFLNIRSNRKVKLYVGEKSIVEGNIIFEKENAEISIGKNTFIGSSNIISAKSVTVGDDVLIAWGCTIVDHNSHSIFWNERKNDVKDWYVGKKNWKNVKSADVIIKNKVWIGFNSIILKGVTIGEGAVIGAGSVVAKDVEPYTVVVGNPAKFVKRINDR